MEPKRSKFTKWHKGRLGSRVVASSVTQGKMGLRVLEPCRMTAREIDAGYRALRQNLPRSVRIRIRPFPDRPVTSTPIGRRMGKGKGSVRFWSTYVRAGTVIYEVDFRGQLHKKVEKGLIVAGRKMPVKTVVTRRRLGLL